MVRQGCLVALALKLIFARGASGFKKLNRNSTDEVVTFYKVFETPLGISGALFGNRDAGSIAQLFDCRASIRSISRSGSDLTDGNEGERSEQQMCSLANRRFYYAHD